VIIDKFKPTEKNIKNMARLVATAGYQDKLCVVTQGEVELIPELVEVMTVVNMTYIS
jgi:hypothetical protein